jgi:hypothetical protein
MGSEKNIAAITAFSYRSAGFYTFPHILHMKVHEELKKKSSDHRCSDAPTLVRLSRDSE